MLVHDLWTWPRSSGAQSAGTSVSDEERTGSCVVCQERDPLPDLTPVCGPCRSRVAGQLRDIPVLCLLLGAGPRPQVTPGELTEVRELVMEFGPDELLEVTDVEVDWLERIAHEVRTHEARTMALEAGPVKGLSNAPRVAGSRGRSMPINADAADLLDIADERTVGDYHQVPMVRSTGETRWQIAWFGGKAFRQEVRVREVVSTARMSRCRCGRPELHERHRPVMVPAADQVGQVSVASVLNAWVRDFAERRREVGPEPEVPLLCTWLADRLEWAFTSHGAVDEFAGEVGDVWHALVAAAGLPRPREELCEGIPCKSVDCDLKTLYRLPVSFFMQKQYVECASCQRLYTPEEYADWARLNSAAVCGKRNGEWWCSLAKKHDGPCAPYEREDAA